MSQRYIGGLIYNPPGGFSGAFDGSGDYLTAPDGTAFTVGSGDWTLEAWIFSTATGSQKIAGQINSAGQTTSLSFGIALNSSSQPTVEAASGGTFYSASSSSAITLNAWTHIAAVRDGTTIRLYVNGTQAATVSVSTNSLNDSSDPFGIGRYGSYDAAYFSGYVSNLRFVKGTCLYPSGTAFTTPTGPLQAVTNTQLLTCAYSTFRDGSTNNFTITVNGNTAVSTQNPFPLTTLPNPALGNQGNGVYSMSQYQSLLSQNLWPAVDPYWRYVTLMLHGNGTNGAQNNTFLDSSTNNFTITRNGNTTQGTFSPYGSNWSNYFDGSGDYLQIPNTSALNFDGQFCVEGWVNFSALNTQNFLVSQFNEGGESGWLIRHTGTNLRLYASNGAILIDRAWTPTIGVWYHFAVTRDSSNNVRMFVDGSQIGTTATSITNNPSTTVPARVGGHPGIATDTNAYLSNIRVVKGSAVYTSNFTPSTSPLTAITNTSLLTCQSNRFIDNSTNAFAITVNGTPSIQRFSPFAPTAPYAAGTDGGSGYFDGSGDSLTFATNTAFSFGTGDFTISVWIYTGVDSLSPGGYSRTVFTIGDIIGYLRIAAYHGGTTGAFRAYTGTTHICDGSTVKLSDSAWHNITIVRESGNVRHWIDGIYVGTVAYSTSITNTITNGIGADMRGPDPNWNGYISALYVNKGTALFTGTSNITVPTTPPTSSSGNSLLTNFTNAGIIDNAEMNNLETVGNAQISTAQSKFGGGSMAFDGTGDWLTAPNSKGLYIGSGDFTIEGWLYLNALGSVRAIVSQFNSNGSGPGWTLYTKTTNVLEFYGGSGTVTVTGTAAIAATTWTHFAVVRSGSTITIYVNGTAGGTATNSSFSDDTSALVYVGGRADSASLALNGYIDDLRITKGYARYTTSFTPQRSQWQDQ